MRLGVLIVAVMGLGIVPLVSGCGSSNSSSGSTESSSSGGGKKTVAGVQANDHGTKTASSSGKTEVELDDFYFEPTVIRGKPGAKVRLELKNEGTTEHTFTIDSQGVNQDLQPGDEAEVTVTIPKSGAVSFYCKFHKSSGMAGALAVSGGTGGMTDTGGGTTTNGGKGY
jgi:plastocyanin